MNLPSLLGRDDSGGGHCPGQVQGQGQGQGWFWAWGGACLAQRHFEWEVNILEDARYQQKYDTFKSVYHPDSENDVELADWNALYLPGSDVT